MGYPNGPLLRVLAERVRANLYHIDDRASKWDPKSPDRDNPPYSDTYAGPTLSAAFQQFFVLAGAPILLRPSPPHGGMHAGSPVHHGAEIRSLRFDERVPRLALSCVVSRNLHA